MRPPLKRLLSTALSLALLGFVAHPAVASPELDRQYALASIGILRAWDNVDGLFGDLVTKTFEEHLSTQTRFVVNDLAKAIPILQSSKLPYQKTIEDPEILAQIAKTLRLDTYLRTKVYKEGPYYRFAIDWIRIDTAGGKPSIQLIGSDRVELDQPFRGDGEKTGTEMFRTALVGALDRLIAKVPFKGSVTGRDQTSLTVNLGSSSGVGKGDTIVLATIDEVKFHPLLREIVDWRMTSTGKAVVDEVEEGMAFAHVEAEEFGRQILRFQKVVQVIPAPEKPKIETTITDQEERTRKASEPPRVGWVAPGGLVGTGGRDATGADSSGFLYGFKAEAQAWMTSDFFGELRYAYGSAVYRQTNPTTGAVALENANLTMSQIRLAGGWFYHVTPNFFGPKGWLKIGYQGTSYGLPYNAAARTTGVSFSGLFLGIGGDLPIRTDWGVILDADFGIFGNGTEDAGLNGTESGTTAVDFFAGGYVWLEPKMKFQFGFDYKAHSLGFVSGASIDFRVFTVSPSLLFYF
jgi:hypothetical protein